jgi:hypothetical protein
MVIIRERVRRLSNAQAAEVLAHPEVSLSMFADNFNVSHGTVSQVRLRKTYRWVSAAECGPDCPVRLFERKRLVRPYRPRHGSEWSKKPGESKSEYWRRRHIGLRYGISPEQFEAKLAEQQQCCAVCGSDDPSRNNGNWSVDHDHVTGQVRGIVCHHCNILLGAARDDPAILRHAVAYLERYSRG